MKVDKDIDVLGKSCPLPLITLAKNVHALSKGQIVRIIGNDPLFESSLLDFCAEGGHEIIETSREGKNVTILFKLGGAANG